MRTDADLSSGGFINGGHGGSNGKRERGPQKGGNDRVDMSAEYLHRQELLRFG